MHLHTVAKMASDLRNKEYSALELTEHFLNRIQQLDPALNSFITLTPELAREQAKMADLAFAQNEAKPLTGIPFAQKDIFCTQGIKTSCGSKMLDNFISPYDATVVERCHQAGLVMLGKTNMDEFAMGSSNENSYYGPVKNPWDLERVPGGSSGGSAAAVAARLVPAATGSDTGGSIRQPAALCNLTGIKPTYGRVSRYGMVAFASSLDQAGLFTLDAQDAALLLNVIAGPDARDATCSFQPAPDFTLALSQSLKGRKIGLPKEYFTGDLDPQIAKCMEETLAVYQSLGAELVSISLPNSRHSIAAYYVIAPAECSSNLSRFDGVRYGYRCDNPRDLVDLYERSRGEAFGTEVKRRIMVGTYVLSSGHYDAYYLKALQLRQAIKADFDQAFRQVDLIFSPTVPSVAFKLGEKNKDPVNMYLSDIYTISANLAGLPAISAPAGFIEGLPVGFQLLAPAFEEGRLLNAVHQYQQHSAWHQQLPHFI